MNKLKFLSPKDVLCQVWLKFALVVLEKILTILSMYFCFFPYYIPLKKGVALLLNKPEFPSPKDALCQVRLKLTQGFWRIRR